jgi:hypothetical protein
MQKAAIAILASVFLAGAPAFAITVETRYSDAFQKKLASDYGVREGERLSLWLREKVEATLKEKGVAADRVVITLEDARPNRPTMKQVSDKPGLDPILSFGLGGADLTGVAFDASGTEIGRVAYKWYETDISNAMNVTTWHDARWTFSRFANRMAKELD